jgi:hypothetical protein
MTCARSRPSRAHWARLVASLTVAIQLACSTDAGPPGDAVDASAETRADITDEPTPTLDSAVADSRDSAFIPCTPGDEPIACPAISTGCPSLSYCSERFGLMCPCRSCTWVLEAGVCFWVVTTDNPGINIVERRATEGGSQRLQQITSGSCRDDEFGFFVTRVPGMTTVTLCPASCAQHEDDPTLMFTLDRGPCPAT